MFRERLREAIKIIDEMVRQSDVVALQPLITERVDAMRMLAAAARAYACERCDGKGKMRDEHDGIWHLCPDCAEWRRIADGGEE